MSTAPSTAKAKISPIPNPASTLSPYLVAKGAAAAIDFYKRAFGAEEIFRLSEPSGRVGHAELRILGAQVMLADEYPDFGALSPASIGGCPITLHVYVADADEAVARAVAAGAMVVRPLKDEFYGDRTARLADPFGYNWQISSRIEAVDPAEMQKRWNKMMAG